jgi:LemA protein
MNAQGIQAKVDAENMLSGTLKSLFAVSENYPELKASANFIDLQQTRG